MAITYQSFVNNICMGKLSGVCTLLSKGTVWCEFLLFSFYFSHIFERFCDVLVASSCSKKPQKISLWHKIFPSLAPLNLIGWHYCTINFHSEHRVDWQALASDITRDSMELLLLCMLLSKNFRNNKKFTKLTKCVVSFCHGFLTVFLKKWLDKIFKIANLKTVLRAAVDIHECLFRCSEREVLSCAKDSCYLRVVIDGWRKWIHFQNLSFSTADLGKFFSHWIKICANLELQAIILLIAFIVIY